MNVKEAFEILGLKEGEDFKKISETYYDMLRKLLTPNGEHWFDFEDRAQRITTAFFVISNQPQYLKERALNNFWSFVKEYTKN